MWKLFFLVIFCSLNFSEAYHNISASCEFYVGPNDKPACVLSSAFVIKNDQNVDIKKSRFLRWTDAKIVYLNAFDSVLHYIPSIIFTRFPNLEHLILEEVYVTTIEHGSFVNCSKLKYLSLARNNLSSIPDGAFEICSEIMEINLRSNDLKFIASDAFRGLSNLQTLNIEDNKLESNQPQFAEIPGLNFLNLASNYFLILPEDLIENLDLDELNLNDNDLIRIPRSFFKNSINLTKLKLNSNKLDIIHGSPFSTLENLLILHLHNNTLPIVSNSLFINLTSLEELRLDNNKINFIETNAFDDLHGLKRLNLSHNNFASTTSNPRMNLKELGFLEELDLSHNSIHFIKEDFEMSAYMKKLFLNNNKIYGIHPSTFEMMEILEILMLNNNQLQFLPNEIFSNNFNLKELNLSHNQLTRIEYQLFENLLSLKKLNLSSNQINQISPDFKDIVLLNITSIDLEGNLCVDDHFNESIFLIIKEEKEEEEEIGVNIFDECIENFHGQIELSTVLHFSTIASLNEDASDKGNNFAKEFEIKFFFITFFVNFFLLMVN